VLPIKDIPQIIERIFLLVWFKNVEIRCGFWTIALQGKRPLPKRRVTLCDGVFLPSGLRVQIVI
jgi:hypothetical protein